MSVDQKFLDLMASYRDSATSYYLSNKNIDTRDNSNLTDDDFIALLKTYDEVLILDDHYTFNTLDEKTIWSDIFPQDCIKYQIFLLEKGKFSSFIKHKS